MQEISAQIWDAIIVGAGPAGCSAAYDLAHSGRRVLILDKSDFPRAKACAGGLTMKTVRALRYSVEPVTRTVIHRIVLEGGKRKPALLKTPGPACVMTVRSEFDAYCLGKTLETGAIFRKIRNVKSVLQTNDGIAVETDTEYLQAKFVIGADGVHSAVRRFCENAGTTSGGFALEAQVPLPSHHVDLTFDLDAVRYGYGWIFPKNDHLNVGLGYFGGETTERLNRERLVDYVRRKLGTEVVEHVVGQYLGIRGWDGPCAYGRILLAGDAAGLVDALTAEGIYSAVKSGQVAASAIESELRGEATAAEAYQAGLSTLRKKLSLSTRLARSFYAHPDRVMQVVSFPGMRTAVMKPYARRLVDSGVKIVNLARRWQSA